MRWTGNVAAVSRREQGGGLARLTKSRAFFVLIRSAPARPSAPVPRIALHSLQQHRIGGFQTTNCIATLAGRRSRSRTGCGAS